MPILGSRAAAAATAFGQLVSSGSSVSRDANFKFDGLLLKGNVGDTTDSIQEISPPSTKDYSPNNLTLTGVGATKPTKFTPLAGNNYSTYFSGTSLATPSSTNTNIGTGDFTVEFWFYTTSVGGNYCTYWNLNQYTNGILYRQNYAGIEVYINNSQVISPSGTVVPGRWNHTALVRYGTALTLYLNGFSIASTTNSASISPSSTMLLGTSAHTTGENFPGYMSNFRFVVGNAVYKSNFTPPTSPLTAITGTQLLTCQSSTFIDNSTNNFTMTPTGPPVITQLSPFQLPSTYDFYGSQYFNGTSDYVTLTAPTTLTALGTNNFTIECWVYLTSAGSNQYICDARTSAAWCLGWGLMTVGQLSWYTGSAGVFTYTGVNYNAWYHIAVVRSGTNMTLFVNGINVQTGSDSTNYTATAGAFYLGTRYNAATANLFGGYISNFRLVNGTALYSNNFTPNATLSNVSNTQLLTFQYYGTYNNNTLVDKSTYNALITRNGSMAPGTMSPYGNNYSMYLGGSADAIRVGTSVAPLAMLNSAGAVATIEVWVYPTSFRTGGNASSFPAILAIGGTYLIFGLNNGVPTFYWWTGSANSLVSPTALTVNTWAHIAVSINGSGSNNIKMHVNGALVATGTFTNISWASASNGDYVYVGQESSNSATSFWLGYISNLRVINGAALYSNVSQFTPSAVPLTPTAQTVLMVGGDSLFIDRSVNNYPITLIGSPKTAGNWSPFAPAVFTQNQGNYSALYNGSTDYHLLPTGGVMDPLHKNTADWTFECWFYGTATASGTLLSSGAGSVNVGFYIGVSNNSTRDIAYQAYNGSAVVKSIYTATNTWALNQWNHVAVTFTQSTGLFGIFLNGTSQSFTVTGSSSYSSSTASFQPAIGRYQYSTPGGYFTGYISNMRVITGTNIYPNGFQPSTTPLAVTSNSVTSLLTLQNTTIIDASNNKHVITAGGTPRVTAFSPFSNDPLSITGGTIISPYTTSGSIMTFSGTDYAMVPHSTTYDFSTGGSWSIEAWIYTTGSSGTYRTIIAKRNAGQQWEIFVAITTTYFGFFNGTQYLTNIPILNNIWYHVAACYDGSTLRLFVNGVQGYSGAVNAVTGTDNIYLGAAYFSGAGQEYFTGYIADLRVIRGRAIYTAPFIPPTSQLAATPETLLLIKGDNAAIFDNTGCNDFQTVNNAAVSTAVTKFGTGSIKLTSSTNDFLYIPANTLFNTGTADWTVESWVYLVSMPTADAWPASWTGTFVLASTGTPSQGDGTDCIIGQTKLLIQINDVAYTSPNTHGMVINTWYHIAYVRYGSTINFYVNGNSIGQVTSLPANGTGSGTYIGCETNQGAYFNGYIDDLRLTRYARYTTPFFPIPTTSFQETGPSSTDPGTVIGGTVAGDGLSSATAGTSAAAIKAQTNTNTDGVYWINLPTVGPTQVYCIMNSAVQGGGWMMAMKATTGTTFQYSSTHWNSVTTLNPSYTNRGNADAKFDTMNYFQATDIMAVWPDITTNGGSLGTNAFGCWTWLESNFNAGTKTTLINFFNTAGTFNTGNVNTAGNYGGYFIKDAKTFSGWASGVFSSQPDIRFYGFNYKNYPNGSYDNGLSKVRWGFGWNENGEGLYSTPASMTNAGSVSGSNDVSGGIGMDSNRGNYSAGDHVACCQDTTGINKSARVEIYIR